jgi:Holliday junction resolvasome RuvABC endonuclease subunit
VLYAIGLDLSLRNTGLAVVRGDGTIVKVCSFGASLERGATMQQKVERLVGLTQRIVQEVRVYHAEAFDRGGEAKVAIENYAFGARGAQNDLGELHGCVKMQLHLSLHLYPKVVSPSSYRKMLLGKGNATKQQSYEHAQRVLTDAGLAVRNNDEADAYLVAEWLRRATLEEVE